MDAALVVPGDEFSEHMPKVSFIPDPHPVKTLPAKRPYQPLNVCCRIGCAVWNRYSPDAQSFQTLDSNDRNSRSLFLRIGFLAMRL